MAVRWLVVAGLVWAAGCLQAPPDSSDVSSGDASPAEVDAALECPEPIEPPGGQCPVLCTACVGKTCVIGCSGDCAATIGCPAGFDCLVQCASSNACAGVVVNCPGPLACEVDCVGSGACNGTVMNCAGGPCVMSCSADLQVCTDALVHCATGPCRAECAGEEEPPALDCGPSCACVGC